MHQINTVNDLMEAAASALQNHDPETLENLKRVVESWMQDDESTNAQTAMLNVMLEVAYDFDDCDNFDDDEHYHYG